jgi:Transglycosylase SLT domain
MMPHSDSGLRKDFYIYPWFFSLVLSCLLCLLPSPAAGHPLLKKYIIEYNLATIEKSLKDNSYRGEAGILRIRPEVANRLGIKAFIDEDYQDAIRLFKEAENAFERAKKFMRSQERGRSSGYFAKNIADNVIRYKTISEEAKNRLLDYHSRLNPEIDQRFDNNICEAVLDRLLEEGLAETDNRLRDALAYLYNICQGVNRRDFPLTSDNIPFVNYVFNNFLEQALEKDIEMYDLDRDGGHRSAGQDFDWKAAFGSEISEFIGIIETVIKKYGGEMHDVDPLLFVALMKKESDFHSLAISHMGAAGLTQIMPSTAKEMGMNNIFLPEYYNDALLLVKQERESRNQAMDTLFKITEDENKLQYAEQARALMQASLDLRQQREALIKRYKKELLTEHTDERLDPAKAIEYGLIYFASLMKARQGDISLALASYNAGGQRVEEHKGIPPISETISFRNEVLRYYHDYLSKIKKTKGAEESSK